MVRIGANPIGWSNDDLRSLGGETPLETCLAEAKEAGFEGMELGHKFPKEPDALRAVLDRFGLSLVSGWHSAELLRRSPEEEMAALRPHLDLLKALGSTVLVLAETSNAIHGDRSKPLDERPVLDASAWAEFGRRITAVADRTLAEGLRLVYHHHMGTAVQSEADIDRLMEATGPAVPPPPPPPPRPRPLRGGAPGAPPPPLPGPDRPCPRQGRAAGRDGARG